MLDSTLRLPLESRLVQTANDDLIVFCTTFKPDHRRALEALRIRVEQIEPEPASQRVSLKHVLKRLGELEIASAMLEAGSQLNSAAINGSVDRLCLFYAPIFLGASAVPLLDKSKTTQVQTIRTRLTKFGPDFRMEAWLSDPWSAIQS